MTKPAKRDREMYFYHQRVNMVAYARLYKGAMSFVKVVIEDKEYYTKQETYHQRYDDLFNIAFEDAIKQFKEEKSNEQN